jgi:hypothetical protein
MVFSSWVSFSQDYKTEYIKLIKKNTIDSIQTHVISPLNDTNKKNNILISKLNSQLDQIIKDTIACKKLIKDLNNEVKELNSNKFKLENSTLKAQLKEITDKYNNLNSTNENNIKLIADKDSQIKNLALIEKENGKKEVVKEIINTYKNRKFDELINGSTKATIERDNQLIGNNSEISDLLLDLDTYFTAKELLNQKVDETQINSIKTKLKLIKRESILIKNINKKLDFYNTLSSKLKVTIINVNVYDDKTSKKYMVGEIAEIKDARQKKLDKIFSVLMPYIFDSDLKHEDYPYLFEIVLDIIKRKQSNTDEDITDLLKKL